MIPHLFLVFIFVFNLNHASENFMLKGVVVGYGNMGQVHAAYFSSMCDSIEIVEIDENKRTLARKHGYAVYNSLDELLEQSKVDFVAICTPTYLHLDHMKNAMKHHLPIFVEKPVVRTSQEVNELRNLAYPLPIFVAEVEHYNEKLKAALRFSSSPALIQISRSVNLNFFIGNTTPWFLDEEKSGGITIDLMIHDISLLIEKYGRPIIKNVKLNRKSYPCVDEVDAILVFDAFEVSLHADWHNEDIQNPIFTQWKIFDPSGSSQLFVCKNYIEKHSSKNEDPYFIQDRQFLLSLTSGSLPYSLEAYLQAVEIAQEIQKR